MNLPLTCPQWEGERKITSMWMVLSHWFSVTFRRALWGGDQLWSISIPQKKKARQRAGACAGPSSSKGGIPSPPPRQKHQLVLRLHVEALAVSLDQSLAVVLFHHLKRERHSLKSWELINFSKGRCWITLNEMCSRETLLTNISDVQQNIWTPSHVSGTCGYAWPSRDWDRILPSGRRLAQSPVPSKVSQIENWFEKCLVLSTLFLRWKKYNSYVWNKSAFFKIIVFEVLPLKKTCKIQKK